MALSMEWFVFNKEEGSQTKRPLVQFPEFSHSSTGYKFEPMNLNRKKKNDYTVFPLYSSCFVTESLVQ